MSNMQFRMKISRPITTAGTRQLDSSTHYQQSRINKQRTSPKFWKDKENLYDENIQLKQSINELKKELQCSKLRNQQLEKELQRFENVIEDQMKNNDNSLQLRMEKYGLALKTKYKKLAQELLQKNKEVSELKRSLKYTHQQELEIELQNYSDETLRLRQQLEFVSQMVALQNSGESLESRLIQQDQTLRIIQKDNVELKQQIIDLDQAGKICKVKYDEAVRLNEKLESELIQQQQTTESLQQYIAQCNEIIENSKKIQTKPIEDIRNEYQAQIEQIKQKQQEELEQKNREIRDLTTEVYQQSLHIKEIERLLEQQEEFLKDNRSNNNQSPNYFSQQYQESPDNLKRKIELEIQPQIIKKRLPKVQFYEVQEIAMKIKSKLHKNKITFESIDNYFNGEELNIQQVKDILASEPFCLKDKNDIILFSRYLVEDNQEDYIIYDDQRRNSASIIKSVLKRVIGKYELFSEEEDQELIQILKKKLNPTLMETIQMITAKKKHLQPGVCEVVDWDQALKFHEITFNNREQEKFNLIVYDISKSLENINFQQQQKLFSFLCIAILHLVFLLLLPWSILFIVLLQFPLLNLMHNQVTFSQCPIASQHPIHNLSEENQEWNMFLIKSLLQRWKRKLDMFKFQNKNGSQTTILSNIRKNIIPKSLMRNKQSMFRLKRMYQGLITMKLRERLEEILQAMYNRNNMFNQWYLLQLIAMLLQLVQWLLAMLLQYRVILHMAIIIDRPIQKYIYNILQNRIYNQVVLKYCELCFIDLTPILTSLYSLNYYKYGIKSFNALSFSSPVQVFIFIPFSGYSQQLVSLLSIIKVLFNGLPKRDKSLIILSPSMQVCSLYNL